MLALDAAKRADTLGANILHLTTSIAALVIQHDGLLGAFLVAVLSQGVIATQKHPLEMLGNLLCNMQHGPT